MGQLSLECSRRGKMMRNHRTCMLTPFLALVSSTPQPAETFVHMVFTESSSRTFIDAFLLDTPRKKSTFLHLHPKCERLSHRENTAATMLQRSCTTFGSVRALAGLREAGSHMSAPHNTSLCLSAAKARTGRFIFCRLRPTSASQVRETRY